MAEIEFSERERRNALVLTISNRHPLEATEVANLLRDLGADYKRVTGGRLVLGRFITGSSGFLLYDYLILAGGGASALTAIAVATGHMAKFVAWIEEFFKGPQASQAPMAELPDMSRVAKTGLRLADTAIQSGAEFDFSYEADTETCRHRIAFRVTPREALEAKAREKARRQNLIGREPTLPQKVSLPQVGIEDLTRRVIANAPSGSSSEQMQSLVESFVQFMKDNGNVHQLPELALSFETQGRPDIGRIIRKYVEDGRT